MVRNIRLEKASVNVRDSQLEEYIRTASIQMTEEEMRQAEEHYKIIEDKKD